MPRSVLPVLESHPEQRDDGQRRRGRRPGGQTDGGTGEAPFHLGERAVSYDCGNPGAGVRTEPLPSR